MAEREGGSFSSLADFYRRVKPMSDELEIMIRVAIYLCAALSVLLAVWVVGATVRVVGTAFKAAPEAPNEPPKP